MQVKCFYYRHSQERAKKKARLDHFHSTQTGGGPPSKTLSNLEEDLLHVIEKVVVMGAPALQKGGFVITNEVSAKPSSNAI